MIGVIQVSGKRNEAVYVLEIENPCGNNVHLCRTRPVAHRRLDQYVKNWWPHKLEDPMPKRRYDRIEQYFSEMSDERGEEYYSIEKKAILEK